MHRWLTVDNENKMNYRSWDWTETAGKKWCWRETTMESTSLSEEILLNITKLQRTASRSAVVLNFYLSIYLSMSTYMFRSEIVYLFLCSSVYNFRSDEIIASVPWISGSLSGNSTSNQSIVYVHVKIWSYQIYY